MTQRRVLQSRASCRGRLRRALFLRGVWVGTAIVVAAVAFGACSSGSSSTPPSPQPSITPGFFMPDASAQLALAQASALGQMRLGGAWAVFGTELYRQPDAVTGLGSSPWPASDMQPPAVYVLDQKHAWTLTLSPGSVLNGQGPPYDHLNAVVNWTSDGGVTWQHANVPGDYSDSELSLAFVDPVDGYLIASPHDGGATSTVLSTSDAGATWKVVARVGLLKDGSLGAELTASDDSTLWAGAQGEARVSHPILAVSRNGGATWSEVTLPGLEGQWGGDGEAVVVTPPAFIDPSVGFVTILVGNTTEVFGTTDAGRTWAREALPDGFGVTDFIDASHWVAADGATLTATADGGKTWKVAQDAGLPGGSFTQLVFLDPNVGFGLFSAADGSGSYLYRTDNGGDEWELVYGGVSPAPS